MAKRASRVLKSVGGGQDLDEVLGTIQKDLTTLANREAGGEDVSAERQRLQAEQAQVEAAKAAGSGHAGAAGQPQESELERLRRESRERSERDEAERIAGEVLKRVGDEHAATRERVQGYAAEAVQKMLGGQSVEGAVIDVLKNQRGETKFAPQGASADAQAAVAGRAPELQSAGVPLQQGDVKVGVNREAKSIMESKNFARLMGCVYKARQGMATDGEREFLMAARQKALAEGTGTAGGFLVPPEWMPDVLGLLRAQAVVRRSGPRFQNFSKSMAQVSISQGATAFYTAENARIPTSEPTFAEQTILSPRNLTALVPASTYLLWDAEAADDTIRADMAQVMALREDLSFLEGTGGAEPTGFKNIVGRTSDPLAPGANGFTPTLPQLRRIKARFRAQNSGAIKPAWFFHPNFLTYLETLTDTDGRFLADSNLLRVNDDMMSGVFDGVPFFCTTQIPANLTLGTSTGIVSYLLLVNMAEAVVGINREMEITVSDEASYTTDGGTTWQSAFQNNQTLFKATMRHDVAHRRPPQIILQTGVVVQP